MHAGRKKGGRSRTAESDKERAEKEGGVLIEPDEKQLQEAMKDIALQSSIVVDHRSSTIPPCTGRRAAVVVEYIYTYYACVRTCILIVAIMVGV